MNQLIPTDPIDGNRIRREWGQGMNWRKAFDSAYGISVSDFYAQFEQERQS